MAQHGQNIAQQETVLAVPFEERLAAINAAGRLRDGRQAIHYVKDEKLWKASPGADLSRLARWLPDQSKARQEGLNDPQGEYAGALEAAGFVLEGLPVMDGKKHRVQTQDDKAYQKSGVYVGYLDGRPAGWYQDYRNHDTPVKWKASGVKADPVTVAHARALAAQKKVEREAEQDRKHRHHAHRARQLYGLLPDATDQHPYLTGKGVTAAPGVKVDRRGRLVIPLQDERGEIHSLQRINDKGMKRLKKGAKKTGRFFVVGGQLNNGEPILYAEGYSTAASIHLATGRPVVMTVDAGNMPVVAEKLAHEYPDSPQVMLGDDDRNNKSNKGRESATKAADVAGGKAAFPAFKDARGFSDFNDLHQAQGVEEVRRQVARAVTAAINEKQQKEQLMNQENNQQPVDGHLEDNPQSSDTHVSDFEAYEAALAAETVNTEDDRNDDVDTRQDSVLKQGVAPDNTEESRVSVLAYNRRLINDANNSSLALEKREKAYQHLVERSSLDENQDRYVDTKKGKVLIGLSPAETERNKAEEQAVIDRAKAHQKANPLASLAADKSAIEDNTDNIADTQVDSKQTQQPASDTTPDVGNDIDRMGEVVKERIKQVDPVVTKKFQEDDKGRWRWRENPEVVAFREKSDRVSTKSKSPMVASSMVALAESRGWTAFNAKGSEAFRKAVWLEGNLRGLDVQGYTPTEKDKEMLDSRLNQIERIPAVKEHVAASGNVPEYKHAEPQDEAAVAGGGVAAASGSRHGWTLKSRGEAPYRNDPENSDSYFVELERGGNRKTVWGVGIASALDRAGAATGDKITLELSGKESVSVPVEVKDASGNVIGSETINTKRNAWDVTVVEKAVAAADNVSEIKQSKGVNPNANRHAYVDDYKKLSKSDAIAKHPEMQGLYGVVESAKVFASANIQDKGSRERFVASVAARAFDELSDKGAITAARIVKHKTAEKQVEHAQSR